MTLTVARATFAIGTILAAAYFANALAAIEVSDVRVEGQLSVAEGNQVRHAVADELAKPGLRTPTDVAAAVKALGWIREVRVRRHWPDALHVAVARETLAARWGEDAWLTTAGNVVPAADANARRAASLPMFRTARADAPHAMRVFNLLNESAAKTGLRIVRLDENVGGEWTVLFDNQLQVALGAADLSERFGRFVAVYRTVLRTVEKPFGNVDARYDTGVAVRWQGELMPASASHRRRGQAAEPPAWNGDG